jgi:hypothetical protein
VNLLTCSTRSKTPAGSIVADSKGSVTCETWYFSRTVWGGMLKTRGSLPSPTAWSGTLSNALCDPLVHKFPNSAVRINYLRSLARSFLPLLCLRVSSSLPVDGTTESRKNNNINVILSCMIQQVVGWLVWGVSLPSTWQVIYWLKRGLPLPVPVS